MHPAAAPTPVSRWRARAGAALGTLKLQLALGGVLALVLGIGLTAWQLLERAEADLLAQQRRHELAEAVQSARLLGDRVLAFEQTLRAAAARLPASALADRDELQALLNAQPVLLDAFALVFVAGSDGEIKLRYQDQRFVRDPLDIHDRGYFRALVRDDRPVVSDALHARASGTPMVVVAQPIHAGRQVAGLLAGAVLLNSRALTAGVAEIGEGDDDGLVVVSDSAGQIVAHPDPAMLMRDLSAEPRLARATAAWRHQGSPLEPTGLELSDPEAVVSAAAVPGADWMVWRHRPNRALLAPLAAGRTAALRWALALVAALSTLSLVFFRVALHPLDSLQRRAAHLFDDSLPVDAGWPGARGEIGGLESVLRRVGAERAGLERANRDIIRRLETVMAAAPVGIALTRGERYELVSREFCRLVGHEGTALLSLPTRCILVSEQAWQEMGARAGAAFAAGHAYDGEHEMVRADGSRFWGHLRGLPVDPADRDAGTIWTLQDITEQIASRRALEWAATHDPLTGLANRKAFASRLERVFDALPHACPAALIALDLDRFKPVNDRHGHAAGDHLLRAVAATIAEHVRPGDLVARLGGDEFAIVLERCPDDAAARVAQQVRDAVLALRVDWQGHDLAVGVSAGVAMLDLDSADAAAWLDAADRACYRAKLSRRSGRRTADTAPSELV